VSIEPATQRREAWTVMDVLRWTTTRFAERGLPTPRLDAELLAAHAFGLSRVQLYTQFDRPLSTEELAAFRALVKRRQAGEPVAYLTGKKEFWSLELHVDARVLVPRPDTETAVEEALDRLPRASTGRADAVAGTDAVGTPEASRAADAADVAAPAAADVAAGAAAEVAAPADADMAAPAAPPAADADRPRLRIADVGTGSGAIALALAKQRPDAAVFAVDVSPDALAVARANAERLGLAVTFLEGDLAAPLRPHAPFDLVVANLPYIPSADIPGLSADVRTEPRLALDGGADGLDLVRRLLAEAPGLLAPGGAVVLEIGVHQAAATAALCRAAGLTDVRTRADLGGIERIVSAKKES
jgi:release factor glutamine methyltransferase